MAIRDELLAEQKQIIARHQLVGDAHQLPKHVRRRLRNAHIIAEALRHLLHAIEPLEQRHHQRHLLRLPLLALQIAADEDVEKLIRPANFHIGLDLHGIPPLHDWVLDFMRADWHALLEALLEILTLHHLLDRDAAVEPDHLLERHDLEPLAIECRARPGGIENLVGLLAEAPRIFHDLIVRKLRARHRPTARVADHRREIADDQHGIVPEILELPQLGERDGEAEMNVRRRRIDSELYRQRAPEPQLLEQLFLADDLRGAAGDELELTLRGHRDFGDSIWGSGIASAR